MTLSDRPEASSRRDLWRVIGHYPKADLAFVDEILCDDGQGAILRSAQIRTVPGSVDEAPNFLMAIHGLTGETHFAAENQAAVSALTLLRNSTPSYVSLDEFELLITKDALLAHLRWQESKFQRRLQAGVIADLTMDFIHEELGERLIQIAPNRVSSIREFVNIEVLARKIREIPGWPVVDKNEIVCQVHTFVLQELKGSV